MEIITGFVFGIAGSLHCIGMCGAIVLALPAGEQPAVRFALARTLYHLGRVFSYSLMGAMVGLLGGKLLLPALQQDLSIIAGAAMIMAVFFPRIVRSVNFLERLLAPATRKLTGMISRLIGSGKTGSMFALGVLNGFLPCGFVYMAVTAATLTGDYFSGTLFMAGFGFGTIPAMLAVSFFPKIISADLRLKLMRILPAFQVLVGLLLIIRGMGLGIPYLSPKLGGMIPPEGGGCCE